MRPKPLFTLFLLLITQCQLFHCENSTEEVEKSTMKPLSTERTSTTIGNVSIITTVANVESTTFMSVDNTTEGAIENSTLTNNNTTKLLTATPKPDTNRTKNQMDNFNKTNENTKNTNLIESKRDTCPCDLEQDYCDINCCCDRDCSHNDKLVFQICIEDKNRLYDTSFCRFSEYIYKNNTPYEWEVNQNGLFCIVKSNLPHQYVKQKKIVIKNLEEAKNHLQNKYQWSTKDAVPNDGTKSTKFLYNAKLFYHRNNNTEGESFSLPAPFFTDYCITMKEVKYLRKINNECYQTNFSSNNYILNYNHYFENITFASANNFVNISKCLQHGTCVNITTIICNESKCADLKDMNISLKRSCTTNLNNFSCVNLVTKVVYDFYHNGSNGIVNINLTMHLSKKTFFSNRNIGFTQTFDVNFYWWNQTYNISKIRSGNPGYIIGRPILIADLTFIEKYINTSGNVTKRIAENSISRDYKSFPKNFLTLPKGKRGICYHDDDDYITIPFAYSMITKCQMNVNFKAEKSNATEICSKIQENIFQMWSIRDMNISYANGTNMTLVKTIGYFGNADSNNTEDWIHILYRKSPLSIINETAGNFTSNNKSITCNNICTVLSMNIFHTREIFKDLVDQERIVNSVYKFECNPQEFDLSNQTVLGNLDLEQSVLFFDITTEKERKFADPPSFQIKLPYDFFYPFVRIGSQGNCIFSSVFLIFTSFVIVF